MSNNLPDLIYDTDYKINPDEKQVIEALAEKIDISDQNAVMLFGSEAQNKIAKFSDSVLQTVRTKDLGSAGKSLSELVVELKNFDAAPEEKKTGFFGRLRSASKSVDKLVAGYNKAETNIAVITSQLEGHKRTLLKDIAVMDEMYKNNHEYFKEITTCIAAGEEKLKNYRDNDIPAQRAIAERSNNEMETQKLNDMANLADRFEKKLYDLKLTRMISIQMAPQIRMLQNNDALLVEKIQSSIINSIPLWKNQMVIALGLANSQAALAAQTKVTDMTNQLLLKNSQLLRQSTTEVARASEESIVSIDTVRATNENLISTINEVLEIHRQGAQNRAEAEKELVKLEGDLKTALLTASSRRI